MMELIMKDHQDSAQVTELYICKESKVGPKRKLLGSPIYSFIILQIYSLKTVKDYQDEN